MTEIKFNICNKHLDYFENNIPSALFQFQLGSPNSIQWFTLGMLQRLLNATVAIKVLLREFKKNNINDFAIGIIMRPILLDTHIGLNLLAILKSGLSSNLKNEELIEKLDRFCNGTLSDGLKQTLNYFEQKESYGFIATKELNDIYNVFTAKYSDFLEQKDGINTKPKTKNGLDTKANSQFQNLAKDNDMKEIGHRLYDLYSIYSKYDHFGFLFFDVNNSEKEVKSERIFASISMFVNHYANLCDLLQRVTPNDTVITNIFQSSKNYLDNKHNL
jgi:hypothetical protein